MIKRNSSKFKRALANFFKCQVGNFVHIIVCYFNVNHVITINVNSILI